MAQSWCKAEKLRQKSVFVHTEGQQFKSIADGIQESIKFLLIDSPIPRPNLK